MTRSKIETLENRRLLAVDITVDGDTLIITGTPRIDQVGLVSVGDSQWQVYDNELPRDDGVFTFGVNNDDDDVDVINKVIVRTYGASDDVYLGSCPVPALIRGGQGNDTLIGGYGNDRITGDGGADFLVGHKGTDVLDGGLQGDFLDGGAGGADKVTYETRTDDILVGPGSIADDGEPGYDGSVTIGGVTRGADNVTTSVEVIISGAGDDTFTANNAAGLVVYGNQGDDLFNAGALADQFFGGDGTDSIVGQGSDDEIDSVEDEA